MKIFFAATLLFASFPALADSYDNDLKTLFELTGVKNNYSSLNNVIINQMQGGFFQAADRDISSESLTVEQKKQVGEILKNRFSEMVKGYQDFVAEKMPYAAVEKDIYMPIYKETYTHDEVIELVKFYSSPLGKKTIEFSQKVPEQAAKKSSEKYDSIISEFIQGQISINISLVKDEMAEKNIK
ncbi:MAG: DUF2059 domain-containing protein [Gammaproteobacteria bacterium]|nr:MAG: DUF2059 domain-containing protein [Gammaproteobacteria bacterium]